MRDLVAEADADAVAVRRDAEGVGGTLEVLAGQQPALLAGVALRIEGLHEKLGLATAPLPYSLATVMAALATDKKHAAGALRWVLPTADGYEVRTDVPVDLVERVAATFLVGAGMSHQVLGESAGLPFTKDIDSWFG